MHEEQFKRAIDIKAQLSKLKREEEVWERELTTPAKLGYRQGWNNGHPVAFDNLIPDEAFKRFRDEQLIRIAATRADLLKAFAEL